MSENKNNLLTQSLIIIVIALVIAFVLEQIKIEDYSEKAKASEVEAMNARTELVSNKLKYERVIENTLNSILNQYVMIDDRYIVKCSIFEIHKLRGPVWAFDMTLGEHLLTHIPYRADFRQCSTDELEIKFRHIE